MCRNKQAQSRQDPPRSPDTEVCVLVVLDLAVDLGASELSVQVVTSTRKQQLLSLPSPSLSL